MVAKHETLTAPKDTSSDSETTRILNLLTVHKSSFDKRELMLLLTRTEASRILGVPIKRNDVGDSTLGDLITWEEIREWSNLPKIYKFKKGERKGISLLSVFEYMVERNPAVHQKDVLSRILAQVPDWQKRVVPIEQHKQDFSVAWRH